MTAKDDARPHQIALSPVARLNDQFRTGCGTVVATAGVVALAGTAILEVVDAVRRYTDFTPHNDPYGEHDFGALTWGDTKLFWKIDCYDRAMRFASPDPADPAVTRRVMTIMRADEY